MDNTGICKISGFGSAKRTDDLSTSDAFAEIEDSVFWMAPDIFKVASDVMNTSKNGYTSKIDIWSIGCVVLEMWTGRRPWGDEESSAVVIFKVIAYHCLISVCPTSTIVAQLIYAYGGPPVPVDVTLSETAEDFWLKCFAM
jgi:serine/threonine protein kinase